MVKRHFRLFFFSVILVLITLLTTSGPALASVPKVRVLIGFDRHLISSYVRDTRILGAGGRVKHSFSRIPVISAELPASALATFRAMRGISFVEEDGAVEILEQPIPWNITAIQAPTAWVDNKGTGVKVGIIDTGIDYTHPDLAANYAGGYDFCNNDADPKDDNGHGTHVAGIVAAVNNDIGVVGVAPEAKLYAIKVLSASGGGYWSDVIEGIEWAIDNDMQVINMSLGSSSGSTALKNACDAAEAAGIVVVAAAGNSGYGTNTVTYPARYDSVIAVAATTSSNTRATYSSTGPTVELAAPGDAIYSTILSSKYGTKSGTSMASPHVAGVAALAIASGISDENDNDLVNDEVRAMLDQTATDLGAAGRDSLYGFGLVNAGAFAMMNLPPSTPPVVSVTPNPAGTNDTLTATVVTASDDPDGDVITYSFGWTHDGNNIVHSGDSLPPELTEKGQTWTCIVTPNDGHSNGPSGEDSAYIENSPPVADAGDEQFVDYYEGTTAVTLDGSGSSDPDEDLLTYAWTQTNGAHVDLSTTDPAHPTFTLPQIDDYTFSLTVTDDDGVSSIESDEVTVHAVQPNLAPVLTGEGFTASPEDPPYFHDAAFTFNITYQDQEGDPWQYVKISFDGGPEYDMNPDGTTDYIAGVGFTYDGVTGQYLGVGPHTWQVRAYDGSKVTDLTNIAGPLVENSPPSAPTNVNINESSPYTNTELTVTYTPSSDPDGDDIAYTYLWSGGGKSSTLPSLPPSITAKNETWTCIVTATDTRGGSTDSAPSNDVTILNSAPVAKAGDDKTEEINIPITLDGSTSSDADGDTLGYTWKQTSGPVTVVLSDEHAIKPAFTTSAAGLYYFTLTVTDNDAVPLSNSDEVIISVILPHAIHVKSIGMSINPMYSGWRTIAQAVITVVDAEGNPVSGVAVAAHWSGVTMDSDSGTTNAAGQVTFSSDYRRRPSSGTVYTINIDTISKATWISDYTHSVMQASVSVP